MLMKLQTLHSVTLNQKRPLSGIRWLGQDTDVVHSISSHGVRKLHIPTGRIKKIKQLKHLDEKSLYAVKSSTNRMVVVGLLKDGQLFLWNFMANSVCCIPSPCDGIDSDIAKGVDLKVFVGDNADKILLLRGWRGVYLWYKPHRVATGVWSEILPGDIDVPLFESPCAADAAFYCDLLLGETTNLTIAYNSTASSSQPLALRHLVIHWNGGQQMRLHNRLESEKENPPLNSHAKQHDQTCNTDTGDSGYPLFTASWSSHLLDVNIPRFHETLESNLDSLSHGYLLCYSPNGQTLAMALNHSDAASSRMIFLSQMEKISVAVPLYEHSTFPEGSGITWWVSDMQWSSDCLFLACVTKRGALAVLTRFGEPVFLKTDDAGPSKYLPLHPLVIVSTSSNQKARVASPMRQEFSVAFHGKLNRLLITDGYGITVLQIPYSMNCCTIVRMLCAEASHCIQQTGADGTVCFDSQHALVSQSPDGSQMFATPDQPPPDEQFTSTEEVTATSSSFVQSDLNVSQGVIQFAGIDLEDSQIPSQRWDRKDFTTKLISSLLSAWALVLTEGKRRVGLGDGRRPVIRQGLLTDEVCNKLLDTFAIAWGLHDDSNKQLVFKHCEAASLFKSLLNLVWLDSVQQQRLELVLKMVRIYIASQLNRPYQHENLSHLYERIHTMMSTRELLKLTDEIVMDSYSWKSVCGNEREAPHDYLSSLLTVGDEFIPYVIQSEAGSRDLASMNETKLPSCWLSIYREAKSLSLLLSGKHSHRTDTTNSTESDVNLHTVLNSSLQFYATISGDIQRLGLVSSVTDLKYDKEKFFEQQLEKQMETIKRNSVISNHEIFRPSSSREGPRPCGVHSLSQLILDFQQYDVRSAFLLVDSILQVNGFYLDLSLSGDSSHLDELHRLRYFAQARSGSIRPSKMKPADMLTLLPVMTVDVNDETATVMCLAQLMASYFTNLPLLVAPSHHPLPSPSLHDLIRDFSSSDDVTARYSELSRDLLLEAIKEQSVTDCWTVHLTAELLLACCLTNDAVWFVYKLGDWRTAFSLSTIFSHHNNLCKIGDRNIDLSPYTLIREPLERHTHIKELNEVVDLFLSECHSYQVQVNEERMGRPHIERIREIIVDTDPDDFSPNYRKIENVLHAAAVAGLDTITSMASQLLVCLKRLIWSTAWVIPVDFDLPAPPPYCPQSWQLQGEMYNQVVIETGFRLLIRTVVMSLVSLLKGSRCLQSCVLTYIENLTEYFDQSQGQSHVRVLKKSYTLVEDSMVLEMSPIVVIFREFCGLLWLVHVRDEVAKLLKRSKPTLVPVEVSNCLKWFSSALQFQQSFTDSDVLKKMMLTLLLQIGVNKSVAMFIGSYFKDEIEVQKENCYKGELKQLLDLIQNVPKQLEDDISDLCKNESKSRDSCLHSLAQQYGSVNTFIDIISDVTSSSCDVGSWECESHVFFAKFLDSCFEIMLSQDSLQKLHDSQPRSPFLPSLHQLNEIPPEDGTPGVWPQLVPLVLWLQKWSSRGVKHQTGPNMDSKLERSHSSNSSIKVSLTVDSIISSLLLREQELTEISEKNSTLPSMFLGDHSHDFGDTDGNKEDGRMIIKSEGEVTVPSMVESLSAANITSFGEVFSKGTSKDDDTGSDDSISVFQDASELQCEESQLQLLRLNMNDLLERDSDEVASLERAELLCSEVLQTVPLEEFDVNKSLSVGMDGQEPHLLTTDPNTKSHVDTRQERSHLPSSAVEVVDSISDTTHKEDDSRCIDIHPADHDVEVNSTSVVPTDEGTITTELVQDDDDDDHSVLKPDVDDKEQTVASKDDAEVTSSSTCSSQDQYDNQIEPVIKVTRIVTESAREPSIAEENRKVSEARTMQFGDHMPSVVASGVVEATIVQQSLAQQPFSRSDLHRILQAQRSYIEQIMTVVESSDVVAPILDVEREPKDTTPRETTVEQPYVEPKSCEDQSSGPHPLAFDEGLRTSTPGLSHLQENVFDYQSQTQSPLLRIDESVLSKTPLVPLVSQSHGYNVPSDMDVSPDLKPVVPLLSLPDGDTEVGLLDNTVSHSPKPVVELKLLRLPDQQHKCFPSMVAQLPGVQQESRVAVHSQGLEARLIQRPSVPLPLLHLPEKTNGIPVEKPLVRTDLPLLQIDHSHPALIDPPTVHMPVVKLKEPPGTLELFGAGGHHVVRTRRKRRQAEGVVQKPVVMKTTETQTHHVTDDSEDLVTKSKSVSVQEERCQESSFIANAGSPRPSKTLEHPVSEWSPAVAAFHRQIETVEADLIHRESEETVVRRPGSSYLLPFYHKGLTAAEIEMLPIESIVNRVSAAVQTDVPEKHDTPEIQTVDQNRESRTVTTTVQDAATQSEHIDQHDSECEDSKEEHEETEEESVENAVDSEGLETQSPLPQELPQVLAPHLFFGLQFPQGSGSLDDRGFISVVDIPASSLSDLPEVSACVKKEALKPIVEEESVGVGSHTFHEGVLPVNDVPNKSVPSEELVLGVTDALTSRVLGDQQMDIQSVVKVNEVQTLPIKDSRLKSQLLAMMEQLDAIEETAKHVQEEFKDSELLLHTIDQLQAIEEARQPIIDIHHLTSHLPLEAENISDENIIVQLSDKSPDSNDVGHSRESLKGEQQLDSQDKGLNQVEVFVGDRILQDDHRQDGGSQSPSQHSHVETSDEESQIDVDRSTLHTRESRIVSPRDEILPQSGSVEPTVETTVEQETGEYQPAVLASHSHLASQSTWTVAKASSRPVQPSVPSKPRLAYVQDRVSIQSKVGGHQQLSKPPQRSYTAPKRVQKEHLVESIPHTVTTQQIEEVFNEKESTQKLESQRQELQQWMKRRRKLQQTEFTTLKTQLRSAEAHPFVSQGRANASHHRTTEDKEEQKRAHLSERVQEAFNLMSNIVTSSRTGKKEPNTRYLRPDPHIAVKRYPVPCVKSPEQGVGDASLSSGSIMSNIDWDEVDRILDD